MQVRLLALPVHRIQSKLASVPVMTVPLPVRWLAQVLAPQLLSRPRLALFLATAQALLLLLALRRKLIQMANIQKTKVRDFMDVVLDAAQNVDVSALIPAPCGVRILCLGRAKGYRIRWCLRQRRRHARGPH